MEKVRWYEREAGHVSAMRIIAMISTVTGSAAVLAGVVAMFMRIPESAQALVVGGGMVGLGEVAKAGQAIAEKK